MTKANTQPTDNHSCLKNTTIEITRWKGLTHKIGEPKRVRVELFFARFAQLATAPRDAEIEKNRLPGWSPAIFDGNQRAKNRVDRITALCLDYDSGDDLDDIASSWGWLGLLHTTPSHTAARPRCRVIVLLSRPVSPEEHGKIYRWALTRATAAGHTPDEAAKDASRLWFIPACQPGQTGRAIYLTGQLLDVDETLEQARAVEPVPRPVRQGAGQALGTSGADGAVATEKAVAAILASYGRSGEAPGNRNTTLNKEAFQLKQRADQGGLDWGVARRDIMNAATAAGWQAAEAAEVIDRAEAGAARSPRELIRGKDRGAHPALDPDDPGPWSEPMPEAEGQLAPAPAKEDLPGWYKLLLLTDKGLPRATAGNALTIFENEPDLGVLAFDNFRDQLTIFRRPPWEAKALGVSYPRAVSDTDSTRAGQWIERAYRVAFQGRMLADTIEAAARRNAFDPLVEYIHGLEWDGLPRLRTWLADFFGAEQTVYTAEVGRRWMISAVARGLCKSASGIQADHVLVFEGPQGARKSSGLRALAGEFFTDEVPDLTTKDAAISLSGVWLVELSELESLRRADVQKTKAWISRRVDRYRPPYGRATVARPRRCVFAATTNDQAYLKDWSGNRRWWPVACGAVDVVSLQDCRDQLWAEAAAAYKAGEPWWLDSDELNAAASEAQISRAEIDPWEEPISDYVAGRRYVTTGDILENLQIERGRADKLHSRRIAEILRRLGLSRRERHRVGDAREYRYSRPPE